MKGAKLGYPHQFSMGLVCVLLLIASMGHAATWHVAPGASSGDGSPANPFNAIQDGIDAASAGDTVQVAVGSYYENITLKDEVAVVGAGADVTTISGEDGATVTAASVGVDTRIENVTITHDVLTNGSGMSISNGAPQVVNCEFLSNYALHNYNGGGILADNSTATISDCRFEDNRAAKGGAVYIQGGDNSLVHCVFAVNQASNAGGGVYISNAGAALNGCLFINNVASLSGFSSYGGGLYNNNASPLLEDCTFENNNADYGGGIYNNGTSAPEILRCTFQGNMASPTGLGTVGGGGGMYNNNGATPWILDSRFDNNTSNNDGGAMYNDNASPVVTNTCFWANSVSFNGGGVYNDNASGGIYTNCSFVNNSAGSAGYGINNQNNSTPTVINSIFWGNASGAQITEGVGTSTTVSYSDIVQSSGVYPGTGNLNVDPLFVDMASGDLHLQATSPCIDVGTNTTSILLPPTDFEGQPRVVDGDSNGSNIVDMGMDEFRPPPQNVWVDDDFNSGSAGGHTWGYDAFATIQEGIDAVAPAGEVFVAAGHYTENINMRTGVDVLGAGSATTILDGGDQYAAVSARFLGTGARLVGFSIRNGNYTWGGGVNVHQCQDLRIQNCSIESNSATYGGGIYSYNSSLTIVNCTIWRNMAGDGGGVFLLDSTGATSILNTTIWGNAASTGSGGLHNVNSTPAVSNTILWANANESGIDKDIYNDASSSPTVTYSDVEGGYSGLANIDYDPLFFDPEGGNFHLRLGSHCIDAGSNGAVPAWLSFDLGGQTRIQDGDDNGTTIVDMGAYEAGYTDPVSVCVDDDWAGEMPGTALACHIDGGDQIKVFGYNAFGTIQEGIDKVTTDGHVAVAEGLYVENIAIAKAHLRLSGAGPHQTVIDGDYAGSVVTTNSYLGTFEGFSLIKGSASMGGGIYNSGGSAHFYRCVLHDNVAATGGGMANDHSAPKIESCLFFNNEASSDYGGGIYNDSTSSPEIINTTLSRNLAASAGGGIYNAAGASPNVVNTILWENGPDEMVGGAPTISYSDIRGSGGGGNLDVDPQFVDPDGGDFHLNPASDCIDAGDNNAVATQALDMDGDPRLLDGDDDLVATVDMGADEYRDLCLGDFNGDLDVDGADLAAFTAAYADSSDLADLNYDTLVDPTDVALFAEFFGRNDCQ